MRYWRLSERNLFCHAGKVRGDKKILQMLRAACHIRIRDVIVDIVELEAGVTTQSPRHRSTDPQGGSAIEVPEDILEVFYRMLSSRPVYESKPRAARHSRMRDVTADTAEPEAGEIEVEHRPVFRIAIIVISLFAFVKGRNDNELQLLISDIVRRTCCEAGIFRAQAYFFASRLEGLDPIEDAGQKVLFSEEGYEQRFACLVSLPIGLDRVFNGHL